MNNIIFSEDYFDDLYNAFLTEIHRNVMCDKSSLFFTDKNNKTHKKLFYLLNKRLGCNNLSISKKIDKEYIDFLKHNNHSITYISTKKKSGYKNFDLIKHIAYIHHDFLSGVFKTHVFINIISDELVDEFIGYDYLNDDFLPMDLFPDFNEAENAVMLIIYLALLCYNCEIDEMNYDTSFDECSLDSISKIVGKIIDKPDYFKNRTENEYKDEIMNCYTIIQLFYSFLFLIGKEDNFQIYIDSALNVLKNINNLFIKSESEFDILNFLFNENRSIILYGADSHVECFSLASAFMFIHEMIIFYKVSKKKDEFSESITPVEFMIDDFESWGFNNENYIFIFYYPNGFSDIYNFVNSDDFSDDLIITNNAYSCDCFILTPTKNTIDKINYQKFLHNCSHVYRCDIDVNKNINKNEIKDCIKGNEYIFINNDFNDELTAKIFPADFVDSLLNNIK